MAQVVSSNPFALLGDAAPAKKQSKPVQAKKSEAPKPARSSGRGNGRGRGRGRGNGAGRGNRAPRREHDRRSGTGRGKETSKKGHGKGGWGKAQDQDEVAPAVEEVEEVQAPAVEEEAEEESDEGQTYEEYLASRKLVDDQPQGRDVITDTKGFKDTGVAAGKKASADRMFADFHIEKSESKKVKKNKKNILSLDGFNAKFKASYGRKGGNRNRDGNRRNDGARRGGRGARTGGRGGPRQPRQPRQDGGRGRSGPRQPRQGGGRGGYRQGGKPAGKSGKKVNTAAKEEFPTLGGK